MDRSYCDFITHFNASRVCIANIQRSRRLKFTPRFCRRFNSSKKPRWSVTTHENRLRPTFALEFIRTRLRPVSTTLEIENVEIRNITAACLSSNIYRDFESRISLKMFVFVLHLKICGNSFTVLDGILCLPPLPYLVSFTT